MNETEFYRLAGAWLEQAQDRLETADREGAFDVECENGSLAIVLPGGKTFVVSRHAPSKQLWLSSPISGGLHFSHDAASGQWALADGRTLSDILSRELQSLAGIGVAF